MQGEQGRLFEDISPERMADTLAIVSRIIHPKGGASDWALQKTYFLACVESIEDRHTELPAPRFYSWTYGPLSKDLRELLELASAAGDVELKLVQSKHRSVTKVYAWPGSRPVLPLRNLADAEFLDTFVGRISKLSGDELTRLAKDTVPYKSTQFGQPIDLEGYLATKRSQLETLSDDARLSHIISSRTHT
jgi:hypothetical protein